MEQLQVSMWRNQPVPPLLLGSNPAKEWNPKIYILNQIPFPKHVYNTPKLEDKLFKNRMWYLEVKDLKF